MKLEALIWQARTDRNLTMAQLARRCGRTRQYLHRLETGRQVNMTVANIMTLAKGLKLKPSLILEAAIESLKEAEDDERDRKRNGSGGAEEVGDRAGDGEQFQV